MAYSKGIGKKGSGESGINTRKREIKMRVGEGILAYLRNRTNSKKDGASLGKYVKVGLILGSTFQLWA